MGEISQVAEINWTFFLITFFAIAFAAKEIIEICSYFKKKFRIKTGKDEDKITLEKRIETLEKHDNWQYNEISKISRGIDDIKEQLKEHDQKDNIKTQMISCYAVHFTDNYKMLKYPRYNEDIYSFINRHFINI